MIPVSRYRDDRDLLVLLQKHLLVADVKDVVVGAQIGGRTHPQLGRGDHALHGIGLDPKISERRAQKNRECQNTHSRQETHLSFKSSHITNPLMYSIR